MTNGISAASQALVPGRTSEGRLAQRVLAAFRACSARSWAVRFLAATFPPRLPSLTAAGSFFAISIFLRGLLSARQQLV